MTRPEKYALVVSRARTSSLFVVWQILAGTLPPFALAPKGSE